MEPQDSGPIIVDCDILEAAKENVQRLATGRRVTALSSILATPHAQREARLSSARNKLRLNVTIALDDPDDDADPLQAYSEFVSWTLENYPEGNSVDSGLMELMEEATRVLKDHGDGKWRNDLRYLKLWLLYAGYVEKPTIIYRFLLANEIGTDFGLLYEEFAAVLEREGRRKEADEIYKLAIARRVSPVDHIKSRYEDFQKRMMSSPRIPEPAPEAPTTPSNPPVSVRKPLGGKGIVEATPRSTSRPASSSSNGRMQIFVDPTGAESGDTQGNEWDNLDGRKVRIKENVPEVKKMGGSVLKQKGKTKRALVAGGSSRSFVPFVDGEGEAESPAPTEGPTSSGGSSFTPFVDEPSASSTKTKVASTKSLPPSTPKPKFVPFRDEDTAPSAVPVDSVMKGIAPSHSSEAEALRKDPLKNYSL